MGVESFFFTSHQTSFHLPGRPDPLILLSGPSSSGKTSLLFQFAFNALLNSNGIVVFLCNRQRLERNPPFLSQGVDPSSEIFQRIQMKYVIDDEGIKNYFAAFHMLDEFPVSVIIDDFADFFDERTCREKYNNPRGRDLAMIRTLALCRDAVNHANNRGPCKFLLSDTHQGDTPRLLYIYKRWVSRIYTIKGDGSGSYILKNNIINVGSGETMKVAKYSVALQYLVLESMIDDGEQ